MTTLYVVSGYPGTGKTTVASMLSDEIGCDMFDTDRVRKELFPNPTYSADESHKTYDEVFSRAESALQNGRSAVMSGTFRMKKGRDRAENLGDKLDVQVVFVFVTCDESTVKKRIEERDGVSDADFDIYKKIKSRFHEYTRDYEEIDNSGSLTRTQKQVKRIV